MWPLGKQRVGIVTRTEQKDAQGNVVRDGLFKAQMVDVVTWVNGCLFEVQESALPSRAELETDTTTTTREVAWVFLPVADGVVPGVDANGQRTSVSVADISSADAIRYVHDYAMRGDAVLEVSKRGRQDHVFCLVERQGG